MGGWLPPGQTAELIGCYGLHLADDTAATIQDGVKVKISLLEEQVFGPMVLFGLADATADVLADRAARLVPLTEADADSLIRSVRAAPLLLGRSGVAAADLASLRDMLLRVSQLADDLPQVAELELSPVVAGSAGALALDGRIRLRPAKARPTPTCADCPDAAPPRRKLLITGPTCCALSTRTRCPPPARCTAWPGAWRGDDLVVHQRGDGVVVAGDDQGRLPDGPQPGQARPAEQRGQPVHGGPADRWDAGCPSSGSAPARCAAARRTWPRPLVQSAPDGSCAGG